MRFLGVLIAAVIAGGPVAARADDAAALLQKHRAFVGWEAGDPSLSSIVLDGDMTEETGGATKTYATVHGVRRELAERMTYRYVKGTVSDEGFTGRVFWQSNWNGFTHPVVGDPEKMAISEELIFEELIFNEGASELSGTLKGSDTARGTACTVVQVNAAASFPINVCIDPQSGAVIRAVIDPGGRYEDTIDILKYDDAGPGKKIVSAWKHKGSAYTHHWEKIAANVPVDDGQLHPPAQTALWTFAGGQPIPLEYLHNDRARGIYLTAVINGVKGRFLMDTGASEILLNRSFAGRAHVRSMYASRAGGIGGSAQTEVGKADTLEVGGNTLSNVMVSTLSYDLWNGKENDEEMDGVIGYDLFGGAIVQVNLDSQQMTLFDPHAVQIDSSAGLPVIVDLSSRQPRIPMTINGNVPINAILDSGNLMGEVAFSYELAGKYGLRMLIDKSIENITSAVQFASGVGGGSRMECGHLDSLSVGPIVYQNAPACQSRDFAQNYALVGFDFLEDFNIVFDYPEAKIILAPRASANR